MCFSLSLKLMIQQLAIFEKLDETSPQIQMLQFSVDARDIHFGSCCIFSHIKAKFTVKIQI
jgi:hypothetical protein